MNVDALIGGTLSHYRILERLGSGGMGDVYRAEDLRLGRIVALKMLRSGEEGTQRLLAEARAASALNHPNIAVVYETDETDFEGRRLGYIAMEFVEGSTVAALIRRGPADLDQTLDIAEQAADALAEAHRLGLVHRDIKPSNLMVTPTGRVKILDFGVAQRRPRQVAGPDDVTRLTDAPDALFGFVGTLPYMAPEQATGREVDGRADVFALGVVIYELTSGTPPFTGENAAQLLEAILQRDVPPLPDGDRDARLPHIERLLRRMLARDPDRRIANLNEVRDTFAAIRLGQRMPDVAEQSGEPRSVAVAGFTNISGNPEDDWLGAGISETLTTDAGQLEGVSIISRDRVTEILKTLAQQTGERDEHLVLRAGRELRARWVVSGAFQRLANAVRVTASIIDVASGRLVGTTKVDGSLHEIFDLQDRLVRDLATTLRAAVAPTASTTQETDIVEAYEAFSRGLLNLRNETFESLDRAVWLFERAVNLDPSYARAHVELGATYATKADALSMPELYERAAASFRRAIDLQPGLGRAWRELGSLLITTGKPADGVAAVRRALTIDPEDASALGTMARALFIGYARFDEAMDWFDRALERNVKGGWYALQLAHCAALARDFPRGERAAARAMELQEAFLSGREGLFIAGSYIRAGHLAALQGKYREALGSFEREIDFLTRTEHTLRHRTLVELNTRLGSAYLKLGEPRKAQTAFAVALESFDRRVRLGADDAFTRYYAAAAHALRGDVDAALASLERAMAQQRAFTIARARIEPEFDGIRGDARFRKLIGVD
jgi:serine/threonine protein kinase/tetratricopeptide (TPR) repeat protein